MCCSMVKKHAKTLPGTPPKRFEQTQRTVQNAPETVSQSASLQRHKIDMEKLPGPTGGQCGTPPQKPIWVVAKFKYKRPV